MTGCCVGNLRFPWQRHFDRRVFSKFVIFVFLLMGINFSAVIFIFCGLPLHHFIAFLVLFSNFWWFLTFWKILKSKMVDPR